MRKTCEDCGEMKEIVQPGELCQECQDAWDIEIMYMCGNEDNFMPVEE